jgi:hypothetical protein
MSIAAPFSSVVAIVWLTAPDLIGFAGANWPRRTIVIFLQQNLPEGGRIRLSPDLAGLIEAQRGKVEGLAIVDMRFWRISPSHNAAALSETSEIARQAGPARCRAGLCG